MRDNRGADNNGPVNTWAQSGSTTNLDTRWTDTHPGHPKSGLRERIALLLAFAGLGGTAAIIPAIIPIAAELDDAEVLAYLAAVPATFLGLFFGVAASSAASNAVPARWSVIFGATLQACAVVVLGTAPTSQTFVAAAAAAGVGFGIVEVAGIALARQLAGERTTRLLSALTATSAIAATSCPLVLVAVPATQAVTGVCILVACFHLSGAYVILMTRRQHRRRTDAHYPARPTPTAVRHNGSSTALWPLQLTGAAVALAMYVGVEAVFSGWSALTVTKLAHLEASDGALGTSGFWLLMALGRLATWLILRAGISPPTCLQASAAGTGICLIVAATAGSPAPTVVLAAIGLAVTFFSPYYSLILGIRLAQISPARAERASGLLVAAGAAGGFIVPAAMVRGNHDPSQPAELVVCAALLATSAVLTLTGTRSGTPSTSNPTSPGAI